MNGLVCWNCGTGLDDIPRPISRHAACPQCFNELHCCRMCRHNDPSASMTCHEDRAEPPLQKENANFCDFYSPQAGAFEGSTADRSAAARNHLDALFEREPEQAPAGEENLSSEPVPVSKEELARRKLDDLFK